MSVYVMSDLHGLYDKYLEVLNLIKFSNDDKLYILGDIFDRGNNPIKILKHIMKTPNIELMLGNHEKMSIDYYESKDRRLWFSNGGRLAILRLDDMKEFYV